MSSIKFSLYVRFPLIESDAALSFLLNQVVFLFSSSAVCGKVVWLHLLSAHIQLDDVAMREREGVRARRQSPIPGGRQCEIILWLFLIICPTTQ